MRSRAGNENVHLSFENVEGCGSVIAFAKEDFSLPYPAHHHRSSIELKKRSRHSLKNRKTQQFLGLAGKPPFKLLPDRAFIGERSCRTGNHALSAGDASGAAHGIVHIKCDSGAVTFPLASDHEVLAQVGTSAHTAVAQNAGGVVH